eukprot:4608051-Pyramimonas_sp.AAC.1
MVTLLLSRSARCWKPKPRATTNRDNTWLCTSKAVKLLAIHFEHLIAHVNGEWPSNLKRCTPLAIVQAETRQGAADDNSPEDREFSARPGGWCIVLPRRGRQVPTGPPRSREDHKPTGPNTPERKLVGAPLGASCGLHLH